jgi:hypothetical protein
MLCVMLCEGELMIKNQNFKFRCCPASAGNPNLVRVRGAKKARILLRVIPAPDAIGTE